MRFDTAAIVAATGGRAHGVAGAGVVLTDTRTLAPGAWFLALVGERFDGHDFMQGAVEAGVLGGIFSRAPGPGWTLPWVEVADTTRALQDLGRAARDRLGCPVVGLTGSSGKTTTRGLIAAALHQLGSVHQTTGNLNNHLGVPMTLLAAPEEAAAVVLELGTSAPGEIALLADIARPDARLVVNVGPAHLQELGGLEGVAYEKGALLRSARERDVVAINLDDPFLAVMATPGRRVGWGRAPQAEVRLVEVEVDAEAWCTRARYATPAGEIDAVLPSPGAHVAHNAAGALAIALGLGLDLRQAAADLSRYVPVGMRQRFEALAGGVRAINDAYNANPASMRAALDLLATIEGRRIAVLGDMLELGPDEDRWHDEVVAHASALGIDLLVLVGQRMSRAGAGVPAWRFEQADGVGAKLVEALQPGDHVLFKGSRGARVERVLEALAGELNRREAT